MSRIVQVKFIEKDQCQFLQVWQLEKYRIAGLKPQCAGCSNDTFDTGDTVLSVDGLHVTRDKYFRAKHIYQFCVELQCFSKLPKFSNLRPITNVIAGDGISQQDFKRAYIVMV